MYQNIYVEDRYGDATQVHLWDDEKGYMNFMFDNYLYIRTEGGHSDATSHAGDPVMQIYRSDFKKFMKYELREVYDGDVTFEGDVRAEMKILLDYYNGKTHTSDGHNYFYFDIEVSIEDGYPSIDEAENPITSIACYDSRSGKSAVLILDEENILEKKVTDDLVVLPYRSEKKLLSAFLALWQKCDPTIITGWNSSGFDVPYLYNRMCQIIGTGKANELSPIGIVKPARAGEYQIAGIAHLDYLKLYRKFTFKELSSYTLDNVSNIELDRGKVEYEGLKVQYNGEEKVISNLDDLKKYDPDRFIDYNLEDVHLVRDLEGKLEFIELARSICHLGYVPYEDVFMSSSYIDGALLSVLHQDDMVAPDRSRRDIFHVSQFHIEGIDKLSVKEFVDIDTRRCGTLGIQRSDSTKKRVEYIDIDLNDKTFILKEPLEYDVSNEMDITHEYEGAFVREPNPGLYEWVYDLDLTSMYPSIVISLNISPETKVGRIYDYGRESGDKSWDAYEFRKKDDSEYRVWEYDTKSFRFFNKKELHDYLRSNKYCVAANGVVYRTDKVGLIPRVLKEWFDLRQSYKKKRDKWENKDANKAKHFDRLQHVYKILINSVYGVLGLPSFRFYDVDNAEAVTLTGQQLIKFTSQMGDKYYNSYLDTDQEWCIYTDTDSVTADTKIRLKSDNKLYEDLNGNIEIGTAFATLVDLGCKTIDKNGRTFVFPERLSSVSYSDMDRWGHVDYIERHEVDKPIYKVITDSGKSVKITGDHSLMKVTPRGLIQVKASNLYPSDKLLVCKENLTTKVESVAEIKVIKTEGKIDVYDVGMVDNPHVFFANDILVHNSVFYPAIPVVQRDYPEADFSDEEFMTERILNVASLAQDYINASYNLYASDILYIPDKIEHYFEIKQELVSRASLWVGKKRYAQWIINKEGHKVEKLDVKGLEIIRSDFPPAFQNILQKVILSFLKGVDHKKIDDMVLEFQENLDDFELVKVARPTGIKSVAKWITGEFGKRKSRCPAHTKAALNYNDLIDHFDLNDHYQHIVGGDKIKYVFLKQNPYNFDTMAFRGVDDPEEIMEFIHKYVDKKEMYDRELTKKLKSVYDAVGRPMPSRQRRKASKFFSFA